jgi:endonuclease/exonuclease/phosphatase family metal-dependent hydrolase
MNVTVWHQNIDTVASRRMEILNKVIPGASLDSRMERVLGGIETQRPDIVCLQELRSCKNVFGETIDTVTPLVEGLQRLGYETRLVSYRGEDEKAFKYCIAISKRLQDDESRAIRFEGEAETVYMSVTPWGPTSDDASKEFRLASNFGVLFERCFVNQMVSVAGRTVCITSAHLPLLQKPRSHSLRVLLNSIFETYHKRGVPVIAMGDFNTIVDLGGSENLETLRSICSEGSILTHLPVREDTTMGDFPGESKSSEEALRTFVAMPTDFLFPGTQTVTSSPAWKDMDARVVSGEVIDEPTIAKFREFIADEWSKASTTDKLFGILDHVLVTDGVEVKDGCAFAPKHAFVAAETVQSEMKKAIMEGRLPEGYSSDHVPLKVTFSLK